nr:hypothetical protein [Actinomycetota bacterium]
MADPGLDRERRELERRAFARDGSGLSEAEAARLSELRRAEAPLAEAVPVAPVPERAQRDESPPPVAPVPPTSSRSADGSGDDLGDPGQGRPSGTGTVHNGTGPRARLRAWLATGAWKRPRYVVGGLAAVLLAGLLIGWTIPRPPDVGLALRAGEAERRDEALKDDPHDPGSVLLLDRQDDALLWTWTNADGRLRCAVLDVPKAPSESQCQIPDEMVNNPYSVQVSATLPPARDAHATQVGYSATIFLAGRGFPGGSIQRWESDSRMMNQGMSDDEIRDAARLSQDQKLDGLSIVGRWRGLPVWRGFADDGTSQCLIVETPEPQRGCGSDGRTFYSTSAGGVTVLGSSDSEETSIVLEVPVTEERPSAIIEMRTGMYIGIYLMITENAAIGDRALFPGK